MNLPETVFVDFAKVIQIVGLLGLALALKHKVLHSCDFRPLPAKHAH